MAYRFGERYQGSFLPPSIEEYVPQDAPVRVYDALVEALDFKELGLELDDHKVGCPEYDPKTMLKLLVYGYSYGIRSSRKLEREVHYNLSFIWIMGGLKPDHKTIAEFRRKHKEALKKVLQQSVRICLKLNLMEGNTLFVDSSKIKSPASIKNTWTEDKCKSFLKKVDKHIEAILAECEVIDKAEEDTVSLVAMTEKLKDKQAYKAKIENILKTLREEGKKSLNTVDPECTRIHSLQGSHAGYNTQLVVDKKHGLIVSSDVVSENNDIYQFANQIEQAQDNLGKQCEVACADSGYAYTSKLKEVADQGIKVIVPTQKQASEKEPAPFAKENFSYDRERDCYLCPEGKELTRLLYSKDKDSITYLVSNSSTCIECRHFGVCTPSKGGRTIHRLLEEDTKEKLTKQYLEPESQAIYQLRKEKAEIPFGYIKWHLKVNAFLLKGVNGAKAELSLLATCFNLVRMINILTISGLIERLANTT